MRKMFPLRRFFDPFRRGRLALGPLFRLFRSAAQLPLEWARKIQLPGPQIPKSRFSHLPQVFARTALFLVPAVLLVTLITFRALRHAEPEETQTQVSPLSIDWQDSLHLAARSLSQRPVFPFSIVPGGVRDAHELQAAAAADSVVARHYADFRIERAHPIHLNAPVTMYVSYRRNNQVYWTKNRMVIPAGETLLSDGENLARVRCANRLSATAAKPVAANDPTREQLSEPNFVPPLLAQLLPGESNQLFPGAAPGISAPAVPLIVPGPGSSSNTPPVLPPILGPGVPPFVPNVPPPLPPVSTPEPSSFWLLATSAAIGLLTAALAGRRSAGS